MCDDCPASFSTCVVHIGPPGMANGRIRARKVGHDLLTSYVCNYTGDSGKRVPFLTLWYDVIEGPPHTKPNGYQRANQGGACGTKGLCQFVQ